eukprot:2643822-Amphidinium_carterae.1
MSSMPWVQDIGPHRDEVVRQVTGVTQLLLEGDVPATCWAHRKGATDPSLQGVVGKVAVYSVQEELQDVLQPVQQGVGASGGAERMVHLTRQWFQHASIHNHHVFVLMDAKNAFNSVDRAAFMQAVGHQCGFAMLAFQDTVW